MATIGQYPKAPKFDISPYMFASQSVLKRGNAAALTRFRATSPGRQTRINAALRQAVGM